MARAIPGPVQIRHTLLDAECLSSIVAVNTESIQYEFMTVVISSMIKFTRTQTNDLTLSVLACKVTALMELIMTSK